MLCDTGFFSWGWVSRRVAEEARRLEVAYGMNIISKVQAANERLLSWLSGKKVKGAKNISTKIWFQSQDMSEGFLKSPKVLNVQKRKSV